MRFYVTNHELLLLPSDPDKCLNDTLALGLHIYINWSNFH